jgi:4-hydroxythreonine-4-phosphate dehydrogenase
MFDKGTLVLDLLQQMVLEAINMRKYDAIIAAYHDQGLIPFKHVFWNGVNYTGLNKIRTSPDHGTAFDIAGKGVADFNSFKEAVYLAMIFIILEINMPKSVQNL